MIDKAALEQSRYAPGQGFANTVAWTQLAQAMRADGMSVGDTCPPHIAAFIREVVSATYTIDTPALASKRGATAKEQGLLDLKWAVEKLAKPDKAAHGTLRGIDAIRFRAERALAALASDTGERGVVGIVDVLAAMAEAADLSPHSDTIDACSHRDPFEAYHMGFNDCRYAVMEALRAQPAGGGESCRKCRDAITGMCNDCAAKVDEERALTQPQPVEGGRFPHIGLPADFPPEILEAAKKGTPDYWLGYLAGREVAPPESGGQGEEPEVWVNRCPYKHSRNVFCPSCLKTRPPGAVHGQPVANPPAQASGAVTEEVAKRIYYMRRDFDLSTVERSHFWARECRDIVVALAQGGGGVLFKDEHGHGVRPATPPDDTAAIKYAELVGDNWDTMSETARDTARRMAGEAK